MLFFALTGLDVRAFSVIVLLATKKVGSLEASPPHELKSNCWESSVTLVSHWCYTVLNASNLKMLASGTYLIILYYIMIVTHHHLIRHIHKAQRRRRARSISERRRRSSHIFILLIWIYNRIEEAAS